MHMACDLYDGSWLAYAKRNRSIYLLTIHCCGLGRCRGLPGSSSTPVNRATPISDPATLTIVDLSDVAHVVPQTVPAPLVGARNEWTNLTLQVTLPAALGYEIRLLPPTLAGGSFPLSTMSAYQVLSMPVNLDRAGYVRNTGQPTAQRRLPRALLPLSIDNAGSLDLGQLRNPGVPTDPRSHAGGPGGEPALVWIDLHIPKSAVAGEYLGTVQLFNRKSAVIQTSLPFTILVNDFELPDQRHLQMVGELGWDRLTKLYATQFETFTPQWVNRREVRYQPTVRTLDHLMAVAQENRVNLVIPVL